MDTDQIDKILQQTLDDLHLSRSERKALTATIDDLGLDDRGIDVVRSRAFEIARRSITRHTGQQIVEWLESAIKAIAATRKPSPPVSKAEVFFSPGPDCANRLIGLLGGLQNTAELCVFTITDNRITQAIHDAHRRGVRVRIISDNWKATDRGSDIERLEQAGVPVALDSSPAHMHHKFALFDDRLVATGSYNWTRSAAEENQENLVVSDHPELLSRFSQEFERLWKAFGS
ncbi:MAG: endonuclease [Acidobacteria bacterium]|nr:MAG: endonuclease [Acidobacteriota bacterium]